MRGFTATPQLSTPVLTMAQQKVYMKLYLWTYRRTVRRRYLRRRLK